MEEKTRIIYDTPKNNLQTSTSANTQKLINKKIIIIGVIITAAISGVGISAAFALM